LIAAAARTFALVAIGEVEAAVELGSETLRRSSQILGDQHPIAVTLSQQLSMLGAPEGT
jgi:hypothetical protein